MDKIKVYEITAEGRAEVVRQYASLSRDGCTDAEAAYQEEYLALEADMGFQLGRSASCEVRSTQTKTGRPEMIRLDAEHFRESWIDA